MNKDISIRETEFEFIYSVPAAHKQSVTDDEIKIVEEMRWSTFDDFKVKAFTVWFVIRPRNNENWHAGSCTCPYFLKRFVCKHLLGLAIRLKLTSAPPAAKNVPIGEKRRRGRPKKTSRALLID